MSKIPGIIPILRIGRSIRVGDVELRIEENFLRKRVHRLETPVEATSVRIGISATNGIDEAQISEIRVY